MSFQETRQATGAIDAAVETSIRQMVRNGRTKAALEAAKQAHKKHASAASEALLVTAYEARIKDLAAQGLIREAGSLWETVRERYPAAAGLSNPLAAKLNPQSSIEELVGPLAQSDLPAGQAAEIERRVMREIDDPAVLAACEALSKEHGLRKAAAALSAAFAAVTAGPVQEHELVLSDVSRRSPLAPWKSLILAIHHFQKYDDATCERYLQAIPSESAPFRLAAVIRGMIGGVNKSSNPAAQSLAAAIVPSRTALRSALAVLDKAFESDEDSRILKAIRLAIPECQKSCPALLTRLRQHISVRCALREMPVEQVRSAMSGPALRNAYFHRLLARGMEVADDPAGGVMAAESWNEFKRHGVAEGWFPEKGPAVAVLYLHISEILSGVPPAILGSYRRNLAQRGLEPANDSSYHLSRQALFERACAIDPIPENFQRWIAWARIEDKQAVEGIAEVWNRACPQDVRPLILLMGEYESRDAYQKAVQCLQRAEILDGVHPAVRNARLRLMLKTALRHLQKKKPKLVAADLEALEALPQFRQGDRPAIVAGLRYLLSFSIDYETQHSHRQEMERVLGSPITAALVLSGLAGLCKYSVPLPDTASLTREQKAGMAESTCRASLLLEECDIRVTAPGYWLDLTLASLKEHRPKLDAVQLRVLAETALRSGHGELAYAASAAGLNLGGASEARFLLLRARAIPEWLWHRRNRCAAAALKLAAEGRDAETVEAAHGSSIEGPRDIEPILVQMVREKERKANSFPTRRSPGPDYRKHDQAFLDEEEDRELEDIFGGDPFAEPDVSFLDQIKPPPGIPKDVADLFLEAVKAAILAGKTPEDFEREFFGGGGSKKKKGRPRF